MLTPQQIDHYHDNGYVLISGIFNNAEMDELEQAFDGIIERRMSQQANLDAKWAGRWSIGQDSTPLIHTHDVQAYSATWARALFHPLLTEAMADLIGPNVMLHHTKLFQKPTEKGSGFPMHQDYPYFPHEQHTMAAGIIYLRDTTEQMGCVRVVPGSHKLGPLPIHKENHGGPQDFYLDPDKYPLDDAQACPARRGDVLFFNYLTIHGSGINASDRVRKTVLVQFRDPADRPSNDQHSRSHAQGMMLRGVNPHGDWMQGIMPAQEKEAACP